MEEELCRRESWHGRCFWENIADFCSHMGFEELAMTNIDAVLKGREPLTPVNKHLILVSKNGVV